MQVRKFEYETAGKRYQVIIFIKKENFLAILRGNFPSFCHRQTTILPQANNHSAKPITIPPSGGFSLLTVNYSHLTSSFRCVPTYPFSLSIAQASSTRFSKSGR